MTETDVLNWPSRQPCPSCGAPRGVSDPCAMCGGYDEDARIHAAAVSRVRLARDRALDLAGAVLALLDEYPNDTETREQYREELARLRRMAEKSDAYFNGRPA